MGPNPYRDMEVMPDSLETDPTEVQILITETDAIGEH